MTREWIFLERLLKQHSKSDQALPHVGEAQRQMHLHTILNDHHGAISPLSTRARTISGSLPTVAKTRRPSARSTAVIPSGGCTRSRRRSAAGVLSTSITGASFARFFCVTPNCTRQRNSNPVTIPCLRATLETVT